MGEAARRPRTDPAPSPAPHVFHVELDPDPDALSRLLAPFAAIQAALDSVTYSRDPTGAVACIAAVGVTPEHARHLAARLAQAPCVRRVVLG